MYPKTNFSRVSASLPCGPKGAEVLKIDYPGPTSGVVFLGLAIAPDGLGEGFKVVKIRRTHYQRAKHLTQVGAVCNGRVFTEKPRPEFTELCLH